MANPKDNPTYLHDNQSSGDSQLPVDVTSTKLNSTTNSQIPLTNDFNSLQLDSSTNNQSVSDHFSNLLGFVFVLINCYLIWSLLLDIWQRASNLGKRSWVSYVLHCHVSWSGQCLAFSLYRPWKWWRCFSYSVYYCFVVSRQTYLFSGNDYRTVFKPGSCQSLRSLSCFKRYLI